MKKIIILTCLFFYFIKGYALAFSCNLNKYQIGKSLSNFDEEKKIFLYREILNGIGSITIPIEYPCKETEANGTIVSVFFINDKVVRVIFDNQIMKNRILFNIANKVYNVGFKKNQKILDSNQPEQYAVEKNNIYYLYANIKGINENKGNFFELFEIVDKKYEDAADKEFLKIETQ